MIPNYYPFDPRVYVREELDRRKKRRPQYSLRAFARDLEISPSFLCEFLAGRQGLSQARAMWIAEKIKLLPEQSEHFWDLIQSHFAQSPSLKKAASFRVMERAKSAKSHLNLEQFQLIAEWYHFALLEILCLPGQVRTLAEISELLDVPLEDIQKGVRRLQTLGFLSIEDTDSGPVYKALSEVTTVGDEITNRAIQVAHQQTLRVHADAIERKSFADRENSTVAFAIAQSDWPTLRKEIQKAILDVVAKHGTSAKPKDQVVSLTMQMMTLLQPNNSTEVKQ